MDPHEIALRDQEDAAAAAARRSMNAFAASMPTPTQTHEGGSIASAWLWSVFRAHRAQDKTRACRHVRKARSPLVTYQKASRPEWITCSECIKPDHRSSAESCDRCPRRTRWPYLLMVQKGPFIAWAHLCRPCIDALGGGLLGPAPRGTLSPEAVVARRHWWPRKSTNPAIEA